MSIIRTLPSFSSPEEVLVKYFTRYMKDLKMSLVVSLTGGTDMKTGSGKSYTALRIGELIDKDFSIDKVVYKPIEFLQVIDRVKESGKTCQVVVVDEGQITAPAYLYHSFTNKAIFYVLTTFRYLNSMAIFVTPTFSWLDKRVRFLVSHWGQCYKILQEGRLRVFCNLRKVKTDLFGEKIYLQKIRMYDKNLNRVVAFKHFIVNKPSESLIEEYEKKAVAFKDALRQEMIGLLKKFEKMEEDVKAEANKKSIDDIINELMSNREVLNQVMTARGTIDLDLLREKYNLKMSEAKKVKIAIKKFFGWK